MSLNVDRLSLKMFMLLDVSNHKTDNSQIILTLKKSFISDPCLVKSIISTFNTLIGDTSSVQESLDKLNTNFDQLVLEMGGDIDENTKIKIEKAKIAISSLVDFTIEGGADFGLIIA